MSAEECPFNVTEEVVVGNMEEVKEQKMIVPATSGVKVRISKASMMDNGRNGQTPTLKGLKLEVRIVDGIEVIDKDSGEPELKYQNKPLFTGLMDLCIWADPETKVSNWYKTRQHLIQFKKLITALAIDVSDVKVNDEFLQNIVGQEVLVDIQHEEEQVKDATTGEYKGVGTYRERLKNWRSA